MLALMQSASGWLKPDQENRARERGNIHQKRETRLQMRYRHDRVGRVEWEIDVGGDPIRDRADFFFFFRDLEGQNASQF